MKLMQAVEKIKTGLRSSRQRLQADQKMQAMGPYLQHFDVDKVALKRSPMGGWLITFDDVDPTESSDHLHDDSFVTEAGDNAVVPRLSRQEC